MSLLDQAVCADPIRHNVLGVSSHQRSLDPLFFDRLASKPILSAVFCVNSFGAPYLGESSRISEQKSPLKGGNDHYVIFLGSKSTLTAKESANWMQLSALTSLTIVLVFNLDGGNADLRFFQKGFAILRCGSGVLAAAAVASEKSIGLQGQSLEGFVFKASESVWKVMCSAAQADSRTVLSTRRYGYRISPLPFRPSSKGQHTAWQALLHQPLQQAFYIGRQTDYVHLVFRSLQELKSLVVRFSLMNLWQQRALIATAPSDSPSFDYGLRYFAPQYGKQEDTATGSAHVQVAAYWQARLHKRRIVGLQCVEGGGYFECESVLGVGSGQVLSGYTYIDQCD